MCICDGSDLASLFDCDFWLDFIRSMQPLLEYDSDSDSFDCDSHFLCAFLWLTFSEKRFSELVGHVWLLWAPLFIEPSLYLTLLLSFLFVGLAYRQPEVKSIQTLVLFQNWSSTFHFFFSLSFSSKKWWNCVNLISFSFICSILISVIQFEFDCLLIGP